MVLLWLLAESPGEHTEREMLLQTHHLSYLIAPARDLAAQDFYLEVILWRASSYCTLKAILLSP